LIAVAEASDRTTEQKNQICRPNPWPQTPFDWLRHLLIGMKTEIEWQDAADVQAWLDRSRLNLTKGLDEADDKERVAELQGRFLAALFPALAKLDELAEQVTPYERSRMADVR
jgi:hypothetical protein